MSENEEINLVKKHGFMRCFIDYQFSMDFLIKNADRFDSKLWITISCYQELTEEFILRFENQVVWSKISQNQKLRPGFIRENENLIDFHNIGPHNHLPLSVVKDNIGRFKFLYLIASRMWKYKDVETLWESFKKQDFYTQSKDKSTQWVLFKIDDIKDRTSFKLTNGDQLEMPFIYPHYKSDVDLRDLYSERINHNLNLLKFYIQ